MSRAGMEGIYQHALLADAAYVDLDLQRMFDAESGELDTDNMRTALVTGAGCATGTASRSR